MQLVNLTFGEILMRINLKMIEKIISWKYKSSIILYAICIIIYKFI